MPVYTVQDKETGLTLKLEGDSPPTEQELASIFEKQSSSLDKSADAVKLDNESKVSSQEVQTADARDADKNILSENTLLYGGLGLAVILFIFLGRQVIKRKQIAIRITIFLSLILVAIGYAEGSPLYVPVLLFWGLVWVFDAIVKRD
jgi:hypothetical protein